MNRKVGRIIKAISYAFCLMLILGCNVQTAMAHSLYNNENVIDQHYMGGGSSLIKQTSNVITAEGGKKYSYEWNNSTLEFTLPEAWEGCTIEEKKCYDYLYIDINYLDAMVMTIYEATQEYYESEITEWEDYYENFEIVAQQDEGLLITILPDDIFQKNVEDVEEFPYSHDEAEKIETIFLYADEMKSSLKVTTASYEGETGTLNEDSLKQILESRVSEPIINFIYDDFDNNGVYEAIAFCGEYDSMENIYSGTPYLVTREGVQRIREEDLYSNAGIVYNFGNTKIISITKHYATSSVSYYYEIDGTEMREIDGSGFGELYQDEYGNMCMTDSQYDAMVDGTGHTWNVYYFYWDDGLKEYGGTEISQEEFLQYDGADSIINTILADGYDITTIYRRANRIININCCDGYCNKNVRVLLKKGSVSVFPVEEYSDYQEGIIKQALVPEIATYNEVQEEPEETEEVSEQEEEPSVGEAVDSTEENDIDQDETQNTTEESDTDSLSEKKYIPQNRKVIAIILVIEIPILIGLFIKLKK